MNDATLSQVITQKQDSILGRWLEKLDAVFASGSGRISRAELESQAKEFMKLLEAGSKREGETGEDLNRFLADISKSRAAQGFSSSDTATFVFSFKQPLYEAIRELYGDNLEGLSKVTWEATELLDALGLETVNAFQRSREELIVRQQDELLELSTPVVKLWEGVLALPLIGTLDSARTQVVMESLLQRIVETGSNFAIIDITGVGTVDTLVAQHLLKTVTAIRLMGADCIISGIRPQIAQTIVHLGVDLTGVITKATLADALALAIERSGTVAGVG